ncbi:MAG: diaminopimelate decarboxylase [Actinomycetota bacterium]|nr:diaminopimelate decarboxylase [Actinomycetota bacterium]MDA3006750.1 diaminopimelate decarboxylase [Actinomycetota bacterium]MDA3033743.1 diaminopimelate decarboxylase [Actinomycetota bacterium]
MTAVDRALLPATAGTATDGWLTIGGCHTGDLIERYGSPLFVYDEDDLRGRCREAIDAFGQGRVVYATKAFLCRAMARLAHSEGLLLDVATGGELHVALAAGVPASDITVHGNNKSAAELIAAMDAGVAYIVVDSFDEMDRIDALVVAGHRVPRVVVRVTPGVAAHTHAYIATGQDDSKFGFNLGNGDADRAITRAERSATMELVGTHCHIGSNVFDVGGLGRAAEVMATMAAPLDLPMLVLGGGLGVAYVNGEETPSMRGWADVVLDACASVGVRSAVTVEPGRALVARAAITLYTVGTIKHIPGVRTYVAVDGGMSDNPRPVLYGSGYEGGLARAPDAARPLEARVVGKHCESGDVILREARLPADTAVGDVLFTPVTGAYGQSMGSNYNRITRPGVVFVSGGRSRVVVRRETYDDLLLTDIDDDY